GQLQFKSSGLYRRPEVRSALSHELVDVRDGLGTELGSPCFQSMKIENLVDEPEEALLISLHDLEPLSDGARNQPPLSSEDLLQGPERQRERRAKLVGHVGEEFGLEALGLLQTREPRVLLDGLKHSADGAKRILVGVIDGPKRFRVTAHPPGED